jgi:hypothetical protein
MSSRGGERAPQRSAAGRAGLPCVGAHGPPCSDWYTARTIPIVPQQAITV